MQLPPMETVPHPGGVPASEVRFPMRRDWSEKPKAEKTRLALMAAAAAEIYDKGYHAAALSDILTRAGATKGALYHHFPDKRSLALAAMDHFLRTDMEELWFGPFRQTDDPFTVLRELITFIHTSGVLGGELHNGCPMVNLAEDMCSQDEDFRLLVDDLNNEWRDIMVDAMKRGMEAGNVRKDIDPMAVATFFLAVRHGVISQLKISQDLNVTAMCAVAFFAYLDSLRPQQVAK